MLAQTTWSRNALTEIYSLGADIGGTDILNLKNGNNILKIISRDIEGISRI